MIRTAAQITRAHKLSARFHREVFVHEGWEYRFLSMAPLPRRPHGDPAAKDAATRRWLSDGRRVLLVQGSGQARTVLADSYLGSEGNWPDRLRPPGSGTFSGSYPPNVDTALDVTDWLLDKQDDPNPRTGQARFYGEAVEDGGWWRFWALAPAGLVGGLAVNPRWFTDGRRFRLATGKPGKPDLHNRMYG